MSTLHLLTDINNVNIKDETVSKLHMVVISSLHLLTDINKVNIKDKTVCKLHMIVDLI